MEIEKLFGGTIAHAYIFHRADAPGMLIFFEKKHGAKFGAHQNALLYDVEQFGIDDSRTVTELGNLQTDGDVFLAIVAKSITPEAQHALLKTLEEPKAGIHYLVFVDNPNLLLPTLRSRCISVARGLSHEGNIIDAQNVNKIKSSHPNFHEISLAERFAYIEKLSKNLKKDDPTAFRDAALEIFNSVILELREKVGGKMSQEERKQLERILELRKFLNDRGSSAKQLLETMAMQL